MSARLDGVWAKLRRAQVHLDELYSAGRRYADSRPYSIREEREIEHGNLYRKFFVDHVDPIPGNLALAMGDCVQNTRAALDHLAWQLVLAAGNTPTDSTAFPIFDSGLTKKGKVRNIRVDGGIDPGALALVKCSQPYTRRNDPSNDPLAILHDLSNIDKHRTVLLVGVSYDAIAWFRDSHRLTRSWTSPNDPLTLERNAQVGALGFSDPTHPEANVNVDIKLSLRVTFGQGERCEGQIVADVLQKVLQAV
jgi:hypothetical protein